MKRIQYNPYRIAGILANATAKELVKQKGKIRALLKVGKPITSEFDFDILDEIERTEKVIEKAFSNIAQDQDKVDSSLFWFIKASAFDKIAIEYLKEGDSKKAFEIWRKITSNKEVNSTNFSAFNNIGTLKLLDSYRDTIKEGIGDKIKLIESDYFENFVHKVASKTFAINSKKQAEILIDELLMQFKIKDSPTDVIDMFSNCNGTVQKYLSKKFTEEPLYNIESDIESTKQKRNNNKSDAYEFGLKLFTNSERGLKTLKSLLGTNDLKYKMIADNLAKEIMQCGIDYFQEWKEIKDPSNECLKLLKHAKSIAAGTQTKERVKENIEGVQEWIDTFEERELNKKIVKEVEFIITKLNFTIETLNNKGKYPRGYNDPYSDLPLEEQAHNKTTQTIDPQSMFSYGIELNIYLFRLSRDLVKECKPKLDHIENMVGVENELYRKLSNDVANTALGCLIDYVNNKGDFVTRLSPNVSESEMNIMESIGELYMNPDTLKRYKTNKEILTSYMIVEKPKKRGCYIATMAYGDYDHPQVIELRKFRDDILSKSKYGRIFIKFYYKHSPNLVEKLKHKQNINHIIRKGLDQFIKAIKK